MATRTVVFVADDLGVSPGVNAGIARAAAAGLVREASLCVTGTAAAEGVAVAQAHGLGIGLHLSLTLGRALVGRIRGLTDAEGRFRSLPRALLAAALRTVDRAAVRAEVAAQLQRLGELGVVPSHLNGHHHVHVFPVVRNEAFAAAAAAGVRWTRLPSELPQAGGRGSPARLLLAALSRRAAPLAAANGLRWLPFVGLSTEARADFARRAARLAARLPAAPCEWMVHPRIPDAALETLDPAACRRPSSDELALLADPAAAQRLSVAPAAFAELPVD